MAAGISLTATAATEEIQEAGDPRTSSTADTDAAENNEESRDENQESPKVRPWLTPIVHAVREEILDCYEIKKKKLYQNPPGSPCWR